MCAISSILGINKNIVYKSKFVRMSEYYVNRRVVACCQRKCIRGYRSKSEKGMCTATESTVQSYSINSSGIGFLKCKEFLCNISRMEVIPSRHHPSDYICVIDQKGRYSIWNQQQDQVHTSNLPVKEQPDSDLYRQDLEDPPQFSGMAYHFDVKDTKGHLYFTVGSHLLVLDVLVSRKGLAVLRNRKFWIPYTRVRYISNIQTSHLLIGFIEEVEEQTFLRVHNLETAETISQENLTWTLSKVNLLEFVSTHKEVILTTFNEVSVYSINANQPLCNYRIKGSYGKSCLLGADLYLHIGDEITVFSKSRVRAYGPLQVDKDNILATNGVVECISLGESKEGGYIVSFGTSTGDLYFISLFENSWSLIRKMDALYGIYSVALLEESMVVTHCTGANHYDVSIVESLIPMTEINSQICEGLVDNLEMVSDDTLVVSVKGHNHLMQLHKPTQSQEPPQKEGMYVQKYELPPGEMMACSLNYLVTGTSIYKLEGDKFVEVIQGRDILCAGISEQYVYFYCSSGACQFFQIESDTIARIRKNCSQEYCAYMWKDLFIAANYDHTGQLQLIPIYGKATALKLKSQEVICCLSHLSHGSMVDQKHDGGNQVVVGFNSGLVHLYSLQNGALKCSFECQGSSPMGIHKVSEDSFIVNCFSKQYVMSTRENGSHSFNKISFSSSSIQKIVYCPSQQSFLTIQASNQNPVSLLRQYQFRKDITKPQLECQLSRDVLISRNSLCSFGDIPMVVTRQQQVYVAIHEQIQVYDGRTSTLLKKQLHLLKEVTGIDTSEKGILVTGVDGLDHGNVILIGYDDLQILLTYDLGAKKVPNSLKAYSDHFFLQYDHVITLFTFNLSGFTEVKGLTIDIDCSTVAVAPQHMKVAICDPFRYVLTLDYSGSILPVCKFIGAHSINTLGFLDKCLVVGDNGGYLNLLEYNLKAKDDPSKMQMTSVGSICIGSPINETLALDSHTLLYATTSGCIGKLTTIDRTSFNHLKKVEAAAIKFFDTKSHFGYEEWRERTAENDKLVDMSVIINYVGVCPNICLTEELLELLAG